MKYDVAVIGGGVVGALISRELSKYDVKTAVLERCNDIAMGTTKQTAQSSTAALMLCRVP